mgnify:CR=1 FL=1
MYHVFNRGVEKRVIFSDDDDYFRFVRGLREFNTRDPVLLWNSELWGEIPQRDKLVEVCGFCLMPTHFHLLVRPLCEDGLSLFMQKNGAGYTGYYNLKYKRVGPLFQGVYKLKLVDNDDYARRVFAYIHLNPAEFVQKNWKDGIKDWSKTEAFLRKYKWSSFSNYFNRDKKINFPIVDTAFFLEILENENEIFSLLKYWSTNEDERFLGAMG